MRVMEVRPRIYDEAVSAHYCGEDPMLFLVGARGVGKSTAGLKAARQRKFYHFKWDDEVPSLFEIHDLEKPLVLFEELHRRPNWKRFLQEFYDQHHRQVDLMVMGSISMHSMRNTLLRMHPFSVAELLEPSLRKELIGEPKKLDDEAWDALYRFGGFPEPLFAADVGWAQQRQKQLLYNDLREVSRIQESSQIELLSHWLQRQVGSHSTYGNLSQHVGVSIDTIRRWLQILQSLYFIYAVPPWSGQVPRSLTKQSKYFLWDWSQIEDPGARAENFVASHLLKACHFWTDYGLGEFGLYYLRDRAQRELDFCVVKDGKPWILIEVKRSRNHGISKSTYYFAEKTGAPHVLQVVLDLPFEAYDCFAFERPTIVSARTFLSQLV